MILTCPECASRYFVDDERVGPKGRTVRCASCAHTWRALPEIADTPLPLAALEFPAPPPEPDRPAPLPERLRAEAVEKRRSREAVVIGAAAAALGVVFVGAAAGAVLLRSEVVRLWPNAAGAYAFIHLPVNPTGLALDAQGQANLVSGHPAFTVSGVERNIEAEPRAALPLRVTLYDKKGRALKSQVSTPPASELAPGASKPFAVDFIDPPHDLSSALVEFAFDKIERPRPPAKALKVAATPGRADQRVVSAGGSASPAGQTPERPPPQITPPPPSNVAVRTSPASAPVVAPLRARDAKPLPSDSPYALPPAAMQQTSH